MIVNPTEFETRTEKYLDIAGKEEIIIIRNGKEVAKLVPIRKEGTPNADFLYGLLSNFENKYVTKEQIRYEWINEKYK
jgi:antitoxin (DNA-binding transcriptional repressor) of toxin-antitoxin stability system